MITKQEIEQYIQNIPSAPAIVRQTLSHVRNGDLTKAAKCAEEDPALKLYLKTLVNRPIYGFRNEVSDVAQIFGILGVSTAYQILYHYLMSLLVPKQWSLFSLSNTAFYDLQASLSTKWERIIRHLNLYNKENESAISLLPASIIVCDALFGTRRQDVEQLRQVKALDYNTILLRLCGTGLFDLCLVIAQKWEMPERVGNIVHAASGLDQNIDGETLILAKWMHLLMFYELSQPVYVSAGLNEFVDFQIDFVQDIYESFMEVVTNASGS